jgi:hypothetical protein
MIFAPKLKSGIALRLVKTLVEFCIKLVGFVKKKVLGNAKSDSEIGHVNELQNHCFRINF